MSLDFAINDSHIFYPPCGWTVDSSRAVATTNGSYLKFNFSGSTTCSIGIDNTTYGSETGFPIICWTIDNGAWQTATLAGATASVSLGTGLTTGAHSVFLVFYSDSGAQLDRWNTPTYALKLTKITLDNGSALATPSTATKNLLIFGDSIAADGGLGDSRSSFAAMIGPALGAEYAQCAYSGQGWYKTGAANVPGLKDTWNFSWSGQARSFSTQPDYILIAEGVNDSFGPSGAQVISAVSTTLTAMRVACPTAWIFVLVPFSNYTVSSITTGFLNYQGATPDVKCKLITVPALSVTGFPQVGISTATWQTVDSIHPNASTHGAMAAAVTKLIEGYLAPTTNTYLLVA